MENQGVIFGDIKPEIVTQFLEYHRANPLVFETFKTLAWQLKNAGVEHYGSKAIFEVLRYETVVKGGDEFKINNNFSSCYARLLQYLESEFKDFFETRQTPGTVPVSLDFDSQGQGVFC